MKIGSCKSDIFCAVIGCTKHTNNAIKSSLSPDNRQLPRFIAHEHDRHNTTAFECMKLLFLF